MDNNAINIYLPTSWKELSNGQLYYVFSLLSDCMSLEQLKTYCFFRWGEVAVVCRYGDGYLLRHGKKEFQATAQLVANAIHALDFLGTMPDYPVRISRVKGCRALPADFQEVEFQRYLYLENLYQGYLAKHDQNLLQQMADLMYNKEHIKINRAEKMNVFYWFTSLKLLFARRWPNFFQPAANQNSNMMEHGKPIELQLQEATNAQIRALTGGDITKEKTILEMDTWRALTELDAKAREAAQMEAKYGK